MIKTGVTGSIGSGKTIVCRIFEILGIPVYYSDHVAKNLYVSDSRVKQKMVTLFGEDIYHNNEIDRAKLAGLIFNDPELLAKVNAIVHPAVASHFIQWCSAHSNSKLVVFESALLVQSGLASIMDFVITVTAPEAIRTERILGRPGMTSDKADAIMKSQPDDAAMIKRSGYVIQNDGIHPVLPEVLKLYDLLCKMNSERSL